MSLRRGHGLRNALLFLTVLPITPLVDIALMLVMFLLLSAQTGPDVRQLPVALPQARTGAEPAPGAAFDVGVDRDGTVHVAGKAISLRELVAAAAKRPRAVIHADSEVSHGKVVAVVDALRKAGVGTVYYATLPKVEDW